MNMEMNLHCVRVAVAVAVVVHLMGHDIPISFTINDVTLSHIRCLHLLNCQVDASLSSCDFFRFLLLLLNNLYVQQLP